VLVLGLRFDQTAHGNVHGRRFSCDLSELGCQEEVK
jgi:hypothetical protein